MFIMDTSRFVTVKPMTASEAAKLAGVAKKLYAVSYQGLTCAEWAARLNMHATHVRRMLKRDGDLSGIGRPPGRRRRVQTPYGVYDSITQAGKEIGVSRDTVHHYLKSGKPGYSYVV